MTAIKLKRCLPAIAFSFLLLLGNDIGYCDEIILQNGDRLTGIIVSATDGVLTLKTTYSDPIKLKLETINKISSDNSVDLHLKTGEILKGKLTAEGEKEVGVARTAGRKGATVSLTQVISINPPKPPAAAWHGAITIGGTNQSGNTDKTNASVSAQTTRKTDKDRITLRAMYNYGKEDDMRTDENTYGALQYDYFVSKRTYAFLSTEILIDQFKDLDLRLVVGPGVGYQLWDDAKKSLSFEAGISYFHEDHDQGDDDGWLSGRLGADFGYTIFNSIKFSNKLLVYPSFQDSGEFQLRNEAGISTAISSNWALNLSNILEHDSHPAPDIKNDDFTWILGLQYGF